MSSPQLIRNWIAWKSHGNRSWFTSRFVKALLNSFLLMLFPLIHWIQTNFLIPFLTIFPLWLLTFLIFFNFFLFFSLFWFPYLLFYFFSIFLLFALSFRFSKLRKISQLPIYLNFIYHINETNRGNKHEVVSEVGEI